MTSDLQMETLRTLFWWNTRAILRNVTRTPIWRSGTDQPLLSWDCPQVWLDYTDPTQVMEHLENSSPGLAGSGEHAFVKLCVCVGGLRLLARSNHILAYFGGNSVPHTLIMYLFVWTWSPVQAFLYFLDLVSRRFWFAEQLPFANIHTLQHAVHTRYSVILLSPFWVISLTWSTQAKVQFDKSKEQYGKHLQWTDVVYIDCKHPQAPHIALFFPRSWLTKATSHWQARACDRFSRNPPVPKPRVPDSYGHLQPWLWHPHCDGHPLFAVSFRANLEANHLLASWLLEVTLWISWIFLDVNIFIYFP